MKVSHLKTIIKDMSDDDLLFVALYDKDEADEDATHFDDKKDFKFTVEQWESIVESMDRDEGVWEEIYNAFRHYIEMKYKETKGKNDNSK